MYAFFLVPVLAAALAPNLPSPEESSCVVCHLEMGDDLAAPVEAWRTGIHAEKDLGCEGCHGGRADPRFADDPEQAMDPAAGYEGVPTRAAVAEFCGKCHSSAEFMRKFNPGARIDQVQEYRTSRHGILNLQGDPKTATCIDCHSVHGIREIRNPKSPVFVLNVANTCGGCHADSAYMAGRDLPIDQFQDFRKSVHGRALFDSHDTAAPACNDCHGNHGAMPPGVTDIAFVCGQCHARVEMLFRDSVKKSIFDDLELAECSTCHGIHDIQEPDDSLVGLADGSICADCHGSGDVGGMAALRIRETLDDLEGRIDGAEEILHRAERAGMEVSQTLYELNTARNSLVNARVLIHTFREEEVKKAAAEGIAVADQAVIQGQQALEELQFRRKGLASSLVVILMVIIGLLWKIRQIGTP